MERMETHPDRGRLGRVPWVDPAIGEFPRPMTGARPATTIGAGPRIYAAVPDDWREW